MSEISRCRVLGCVYLAPEMPDGKPGYCHGHAMNPPGRDRPIGPPPGQALLDAYLAHQPPEPYTPDIPEDW